jgi:signal transduction histidine kinase/ligand-binding sensor domain-containing protein
MKKALTACDKAMTLFAIIFCSLISPHCAAGGGSPRAIDRHHTSWAARDGAPAMILSITQTTDGWLWLGGPTGLYRFDGIQFEQFTPSNAPLLTNNVSVVNAFADGRLWIGYRTGGAALLQHGRIRNYDERDGLPSRAVWGVEQDGDGRIWAATGQGMFYLEHDRWRAPAASWKLPAGWYKTLMRDRQGVLWAQGDSGVFSLAPGQQRFTKAPINSGTGVLFNLPDGRVVSWDAAHAHFNQLAGTRQNRPPRQWQHLGNPASLLFDRRGDLWVGLEDGLEYRTAQETARTQPPQGLSGPSVGALYEDREGNVWASTATGIDRFRRQRLSKIALPKLAGGGGILADDHGGAWIGGFHVSASDNGDVKVAALLPPRSEGWADLLRSYTRTDDGVLWGASFGSLRQIQGNECRVITLPAAIGGMLVESVLADRDGSLLVAIRQHGLYRRKSNGAWEKAGLTGEVSAMARSESAGLWLAYYPNQVVHRDGDLWRSYGSSAGLALGLVMALHPHGQHIWAGGDKGLALFEANRFKQLSGVNNETFDGITGIVELDNGDLWLNASTGLFHIPSEEIARFRRSQAYHVQYERLDQLDGLEGSALRITPSPSMVLASDGRLWLVRSAGVFRLNPREQPAPSPAQPVLIKTIGPSGQGKPAQALARFAAGSSSLQIDYSLPALSMPERVRFRYRLDDVDTEWQEVGARRSAFYSNLHSGDYHFHVAASDYNGKWSEQDTVASFTIAPAMTETWWFKVLCTALLLSAAYLAYRWHIQRMTRQMASRLQERVHERERIARELHDTLLQSIQSLILHVHAAVMRMPAKEEIRTQLEMALQQADAVVDEGRGRIVELRGADAHKLNFPDAVLAAAARLQPADAGPIHFKMDGIMRQLDPMVYEETLAIIAEAIANAYSHAHAQTIEVQLRYGARELRCTVRDDGIGIPAEILNNGGRQNHWGLRGMAERAARIHAKLVLRSGAGNGTAWQILIPAALAYTR